DAFPISISWSLADGCIKTSLIRPEDEWLEQADHLEIDPDQLLRDGHSPKAILEELQEDRGDEPLYCGDLEQTQRALDQLYDTLDGYNDLPLQPLMSLLDGIPAEELDACRQDCLNLLEFDPYSAESQVLLWQQIYTRLAGETEQDQEQKQEQEEQSD
ncbi:MAG: hypothetical protein ACI9W6_002230, partial [Motiliproteus sp.]